MRIIDLRAEDEVIILQAAAMLVEGFKAGWPDAWPDLDSAMSEVQASLDEGRISRVALAEDGRTLGWIGGIPHYDGNVWEIHPLVVRAEHQGQGIGRTLVADLEVEVRRRGGLTLWVGSDDEMGWTTLGGADLYPNVLEHLADIENLGRHPYAFYQKLGFVIVGVMPDANGRGKPDIYLARRV